MGLSKEQRAEEIKAKGFELVDDTGYKNMKSRIIVRCPHGHLTETCIEDFRKISFECPKCTSETDFKNPRAVPPKAPGVTRIIGFDQATENFGLSIFDDGKLVYYSLYKFSGILAVRLVKIAKFVRDIVNDWQPDQICFEDIQYEHSIPTFKILSMLIGIITEICEESGVDYQIVSPNVWRKYAGTAGKVRREEKLLSIGKVKEKYGVTVSDDIAEAILIGGYAVKTYRKTLL